MRPLAAGTVSAYAVRMREPVLAPALRSPARLAARVAFVLAGPVALAAAPAEASAFERQWHVGGGVGYSPYFTPAGVALHGFGGALHLTYGLSDTINALVIADVTVHPGVTEHLKPIPGVLFGGGNVGFAYVADILQIVPWVGATMGAYYAADEAAPGGRLALGVPFGLDYQLSRSFAIGVSGEFKLFFMDPAGVGQRYCAFLRAEYMWGL